MIVWKRWRRMQKAVQGLDGREGRMICKLAAEIGKIFQSMEGLVKRRVKGWESKWTDVA